MASRWDGFMHLVAQVDRSAKGSLKERECVVCKHDGKLRKGGRHITTTFICTKCNVGLCPASCFERYHRDRTVCPLEEQI